MARLQTIGFETGDASECSFLSGTASVQSTTKRTGTYALRANPVTSGTGFAAITKPGANGADAGVLSTATPFIRVYYRPSTLPASLEEEFLYCSGGAIVFTLRITSAGIVKAYNGGTTLLATGATALTGSSWYRIELALSVGSGTTSDTYTLKIDGTQEFTGTAKIGNASDVVNQLNLGKVTNRNSQSVDFYYDDLAIDDAAYPGACEIHVLKPRAAGSSAQWTTGTSSLFSAVNQVPHDSDTTYIANATNGNASSFAMDSSATGGVTGTIQSVKTIAIVRDEGGVSSIKVRLRNGTTNQDTTGADPGASYVAFGRIDTTDPNTGAAWTSSGLDTIECGVVNGASVAARCTAIYAMVECAGAPASVPQLLSLGVG